MTKPRKGRVLKGSKKAKGKGGRAGWDDEEELAGPEVPLIDPYGKVVPPPLPAPVVEAVYGWRWPLSHQEHARQVTETASDSVLMHGLHAASSLTWAVCCKGIH